MRKNRLKKLKCIIMITLVMLLMISVSVSATDAIKVSEQAIVSVEMPVVMNGEKSLFDFILDPYGLLYETDAVRYGGGVVEEGATLLFCNNNGRYNFSSYSDEVTITNQSEIPIVITISVKISDLGEMNVVETRDFSASEENSIYLAILDDRGNIQPVSAEGEASISLEMEPVSETDFNTYSFGLAGACNSHADWQKVSVHPVVTVTWRIEPVIALQEETEKDEKNESELELNSVSENR